MASLFSKITGKSKKQQSFDNEKAMMYENDASRYTPSSNEKLKRKESPRSSSGYNPARERYIGSFAPNPAFIRFLRFILYSLTSLSALATAGVAIAVVHYYNKQKEVIKPSWGSLIAIIVFGIGTPGVLFGLFLVTPRLFRHGGVGFILNQTRWEIVTLFTLSVVWISGALALACDLRPQGLDYCLWDGFYHYPKPADYASVCRLLNVAVALGYTTFGLCALQMSIFNTIVLYILFFLDQEALTEPTNDLGGRAYRARTAALAQRRSMMSAKAGGVGTAGPYKGDGMSEAGPMAGGIASRKVPSLEHESRPMGGGRYRDDEDEEADDVTRGDDFHHADDDPIASGSGYYGHSDATANSARLPQV